MWWLWNFTLIAAITINSFMIPYGIGFEFDFAFHPLIIFGVVVYIIDIPVRIRTGITKNHKITTDTKIIFKDYLSKWLLLDVLAAFPFEYIMIIAKNESSARYVMLFRLIKLGRLIETAQICRKNSRSSYSMGCFFLSLFSLYGFLLHW